MVLPEHLHLFVAANACGTHTGVLPSLWDGVPCDAAGNIQITSLQQTLVIVGNVVRILLVLAGSLAVIFVIVGALFFITSAGDPGRIKRGKDILTNAFIGVVLVITAYAIVTFIAGQF